MSRGKFIVLEGVDGAGTTTHAARLTKALKNRDLAVHLTREPSDGPIGTMIRQILTGRMVAQGKDGSEAPQWTTMALLFAADRTDHVQCEIEPILARGVNVISDRYVYSSLVYQSATANAEPGEAKVWISTLNRFALVPDICLVLDVSPEVAAERRRSREGEEELYEKAALQEKLGQGYRQLQAEMTHHPIVTIKADGSIEETETAIQQAIAVKTGLSFS